MVNLKALEAAITQVETIRDYEFTFEVDGQKFTLRPLRSYEETEVQRYAEVAWEGGGENNTTSEYQDFMDRVRLATLGFSVIRIGDLDLSQSDWIETGDFDEQGNSIDIPKWEAVRDLIREEWPKALMLQVFAKFGELLERVESSASRFVKFEPSDLDEEIERMEKRIGELRNQREERSNPNAKPDVSGVHQAQRAVAQEDERNQRVRNAMRTSATSEPVEEPMEEPMEEPAPQPPAPPEEEAQQFQPQPPPPQQRAPQRAPQQPPQVPQHQPHQAAPQQRRTPSFPQSVAPEAAPEREPQPQRPPPQVDRQGIELPPDGDSFFDPSDPGDALQAEARRFAQLHVRNKQREAERAAAAEQAREMGMPSEAEMARERMNTSRSNARPAAASVDTPQSARNLDPRLTGLRQAANLQDQVVDTGVGRQRSGRPQRAPVQPNPNAHLPGAAPAKLHGKEVYKMPTQTLEKSAKAQARDNPTPNQNVRVNPSLGARQSKFKPPNR